MKSTTLNVDDVCWGIEQTIYTHFLLLMLPLLIHIFVAVLLLLRHHLYMLFSWFSLVLVICIIQQRLMRYKHSGSKICSLL